MSNEVMPKKDEKRLREMGRQVFSNSFPNPDRKGCPGPATLRSIATGKLLGPDEDEWIGHCSRCSPCFIEFGEFRRAFVRQRRLRRVSGAALLIVAAFVGTWLALGRRAKVSTGTRVAISSSGRTLVTEVADLRNWSAVRSDQAAPTLGQKPLEFRRARASLVIYLPMGSQPGRYEVRIASENNQAGSNVSGIARIENGNTVLRFRIDLSKLSPGRYSLGIRQPPWDWRYYPAALR